MPHARWVEAKLLNNSSYFHEVTHTHTGLKFHTVQDQLSLDRLKYVESTSWEQKIEILHVDLLNSSMKSIHINIYIYI